MNGVLFAVVLSAVLSVGLAGMTGSTQPVVHALHLPANERFPTDTGLRQVSIEGDGRVVAIAEDDSSRTAVFAWDARGRRTRFRPVLFRDVPHSLDLGDPQFDSVTSDASGTYVSAEESGSGATLYTVAQIELWAGGATRNWEAPHCRPEVSDQNESITGSDDRGDLALTRDFSVADADSRLQPRDAPRFAPYAFAIRGTTCIALGRGVVRAIRGTWAGGYRTYAGDHLASALVPELGHRDVAVRWSDDRAEELGDGRIVAISSHGFAVGSAGWRAAGWTEAGRAVIFDRDADGIAHDVADDGTVVGTIAGRGDVTYAFRWRSGRLTRLDDVPHPTGWHFASANAIDEHGVIAGTGTLNGESVVFTWRDGSRR